LRCVDSVSMQPSAVADLVTRPKKGGSLRSNALAGRVFITPSNGELSLEQQAEIWSSARVRHLLSGETLVLQNGPADTVFLVVSGRFEIRVEGQPTPVAEVGVGQPIGEIAFFAGGLRTASAIAIRDSIVLELDRSSFEGKRPSDRTALTA